jgi:TPR repeat protein
MHLTEVSRPNNIELTLAVPEKKTMRLRCTTCFLVSLMFLSCSAFSQNSSPNALRSAARMLTVSELSGVAEGAGRGDIDSQVLMGLSLQIVAERIEYDVEGRAGTLRLSAYWLRRAAEKNFAPAEYFLAGTDLQLLEKCDELSTMLNNAISQNYAPAMTALGRRYSEGGCGLKLDYPLGLQWLKKASEAGDAEANYWIGRSYEQGHGVRANQSEATRWFLRGAELGDPSSENAVAIHLAEGNSEKKDTEKAADWLRKSAEQGNDEAACNLALAYMRGEGVAKDYVAALMWGLISGRIATQIHCLSEIDTRDLLQMTTLQESEATQRANAWLREHHYPQTAPRKRHPDRN